MNQSCGDETHDKFEILIVDGSASLRGVYRGYLEALIDGPMNVHLAASDTEAEAIIQSRCMDLVILDLCLNKIGDQRFIETMRRRWPQMVILAVAVSSTLDTAVEAMRAGATDVLIKPLNRDKLRHVIKKMLAAKAPRFEAKTEDLNSSIAADNGFVGTSPAMQVIYKTISVAAPSDATVFITGESGTGKELYAEAIHRQSRRSDKAIISLNCSAIPCDLIESEIFGHVRGAFTGAVENRDGAAILADGGTLFLDEICEMDLALQAKLLRFIQTSKVQRVGDSVLRDVDVRFVCATNRNLLDEVAAGRFREDLYYRLHVIPVHMPPLREREGDIQLLAEIFLRRFAHRENKTFSGFDAGALQMLDDFDWPGNVRQLENFIQNIVVMNTGGLINCYMLLQTFAGSDIHNLSGTSAPDTHDRVMKPFSGQSVETKSRLRVVSNEVAPQALRAHAAEPLPQSASTDADHMAIRPLWVEEKQIIERAMAACNGNTVVAAALLEVSPSTLYRKLKSWAQAEDTASPSRLGNQPRRHAVNS